MPALDLPETVAIWAVNDGGGAAAGSLVGAVSDVVDFEQLETERRIAAAHSPMARRIVLSSFIAVVLAWSVASAQQIWVGGGRFWRTPPKWARPDNFDGSFNFCRAYFTSDRREDGGTGWDTDFPGADNNFSVRLAS